MQNSFDELWALIDFVVPKGLGTRGNFMQYYVNPIKFGQRKNAPADKIQLVNLS